MVFVLLPIAASILLSSSARAAFTPTAPGPGDSYNTGLNCSISWQADTSGLWKNVTIDLMSGSNNNMSFVGNVISGLDGTDASLSPYFWICPEVDPHSAIYFYQFTNNGDVQTATWTTRFTIASSTGNSITPKNPTQPSGDPIPWGIGHIVQPEVNPNPQMQSLQSDHHHAEDDDNDSSQDDDDQQTSSSTSRTPTALKSDRSKDDNHGQSDQDEDEQESSSVHGSQDSTASASDDKSDSGDDVNTSIASALTGSTTSTGDRTQDANTRESSSSEETGGVTAAQEKEIPQPSTSSDGIPSSPSMLPPSSQTSSGPKSEVTTDSMMTAAAVEKDIQTQTDSAPTPSLPSSKKMHTSTHSTSSGTSAPTSSPMMCQCPGASSTSLDDRSVNGASSLSSTSWSKILALVIVLTYIC
ncbi:hypothetical protein QCA50_000497 [Cerrena zonata]|uniref:Yeast cell wall synthesis Kre9/Knh1-like N-terminal domain-containing protein n=1 Tax=Cerrena zonata TaxID=2478898 RepID=A0AAW0H036_9APHY